MATGQEGRQFPEINKPSPYFSFSNVHFYTNNRVSLDNLRGQYVILDFWSTTCGACVAAFPKMNAIQQKFAGKLQVILVGLDEKKRDELSFYKKYKEKFDLKLPVALDSVYWNTFVTGPIPRLILIDKEGIVKAVTHAITDSAIEHFIKDEPFSFIDRSYLAVQKSKQALDQSKPLLINANGGADTGYLYRSVLAKWKQGDGGPSFMDVDGYIRAYQKARFQTTFASLGQLYSFAYFGAIYDVYKDQPDTYFTPVIETRDSMLFQSSQLLGTGLYNYCVEAPDEMANKEALMRMMQLDLKKYFGFDAHYAYRDMPYLRFTVVDKDKADKLKDTHGAYEVRYAEEFKDNAFNNVPMDQVFAIIMHTLTLPDSIRSISINDIHLADNVSLKISGDITDLENVRKELRKNGLDLIPGTRKMKVLIIEDPKP